MIAIIFKFVYTYLNKRNSMRKIALLLILIFMLSVFCACDPKPNKGGTTEDNSQQGPAPDDNSPNEQEITEMYITIYGNKLQVTLVNNPSVVALVELLKQGSITYTANDYGGFEKVGNIGHRLTTSDEPVTTEPGDVVLYLGNQICIMVGSNSWSYTRIGKISGYSVSELKNLVGTGKGTAEVTLSLN